MNAKRMLVTILVGISAMAFAGAAEASVNGRQARQRARIVEGWKSHDLTRREAAGLIAQQRHIRREEARFRATGAGLGPRERLHLRRDQNRANRTIWRQKHDGQTRP